MPALPLQDRLLRRQHRGNSPSRGDRLQSVPHRQPAESRFREPRESNYLDIELLDSSLLTSRVLRLEEWGSLARTPATERDHVDRFLETIRDELPHLDLAVEGIVDRINGLSRRIKRMMEETLTERALTWGEWRVLGLLRHSSPEYRRSPGYLAVHAELSSGAMTNRLDRLEEAGLIRRQPDPRDRRGIQVELTEAGIKAYDESTAAQAAKEALVASALNAKEKEQLNTLLRRVMVTLEDRYPGKHD